MSADRTGIEWTDATWNPTVGCSIVSPGCTNCYAMRMAARIERMGHPTYAGLTTTSKAGPVWTGAVRVAADRQFEQPLRWKRPRRVFVNSMSDLFHDAVASDDIAMTFSLMRDCPQHSFQVLTKRSRRMNDLLCSDRFRDETGPGVYPIRNVWLGVSVEDQTRAAERIPDLLATPAAVRFLSCEPLLGPLDLSRWIGKLDWVIVGGESGTGWRRMNPDWARSVRDQCGAAGVPFFMKQMAGRAAIPGDLTIRQFPHD